MTKTANIWEYKVGINAILANFVFVKMSTVPTESQNVLSSPRQVTQYRKIQRQQIMCVFLPLFCHLLPYFAYTFSQER